MIDIQKLSDTELKAWLKDRLHLQGLPASDIDFRSGEAPFEKPIRVFKSAHDDFRERLQRLVNDLTEEAGSEPWSPESFHELSHLIEAGEFFRSIGHLESICMDPKLSATPAGIQIQMIAARTLLALGWKGTPDFWQSPSVQSGIGGRWPGIVIRGLVFHGIERALGMIPALAKTVEQLNDILLIFPALQREHSITLPDLQTSCSNLLPGLSPPVRARLTEWFQHRGCQLQKFHATDARKLRPSPSLRQALHNTLQFPEPNYRGGNIASPRLERAA